ncbi:MAG: Asp-tRNA(Asn)/Glu-tRNA(Gln) amidotransferase subunit GatC [Lachnospiraceae bacterium]|jgi:aspartyl-tRNA(Asn)/glutamyl-tRNA(Gln) amidotransferase subunit C|nr:Asp-tRNA(Asn)/Glu-tRNA(Gln) amidotransferase subunit GatC [Lachnospiraceae bacterium]MEE3461145.1 Asp-tRNA(Asn)/Glu-tRNA(Gln) amidotransferase subunit GatC [Lachnospiraceae bacterium]
MRNEISDEMIDYVGILSQLELSPAEKEEARKGLSDMLDYIDKLNELDTSGVEPMSHVFDNGNVFREDIVTNGNFQAETLKNAPERNEEYLVVPKTI